MKLDLLFTNEFIHLDVPLKTKKQIIEFSADILEKNNRMKNKQLFIDDVYKREAIGPTNMGFGVAIPHSKSEAVSIPTIIFMRLKDSIPWEGNETPVNLVFLLAVPEQSVGITHLEVIAELAGLLMEEDFIELLNETLDTKEIITYLKKEIGGNEE